MVVRQDYITGEQLDHNDWNGVAAKSNTPPVTAVSANDITETSTRRFLTTQQIADFQAKAAMSDVTNAVNALKASVPTAGDNLLKLYNSIQSLNTLVTGNTPDANAVTDRITEILQIFSTYPEGVDIVQSLAGKASTTDVVNNLTTTIPGKLADARALKSLKDLIDGLNTVSQAYVNKSIDGLTNNISNIRAASIYPADTIEAGAAVGGSSILALADFAFYDDFSDRADTAAGVLGTATGGGTYEILGPGIDEGQPALSRITSKRWVALADGVASQTTYAIQQLPEKVVNIGGRFKWIPASFGGDEAVMIFIVSVAGSTSFPQNCVHIRVTRGSISIDFFNGTSTNVASISYQQMIALNREISVNLSFDGNTLRWNVGGNFGTHTDARYISNTGNFAIWEPYFNSVNGANSLSIGAIWCKSTPWS